MELLLIFTGAFVTAFSGAIVPGPMLTITIADSIEKGFISGPLITLGHSIIEIVLIILIIFNFQKYLLLPNVKLIVFVCGGIMLVFMGLHMIIKRKKKDINTNLKSKNRFSTNIVLEGILVSIFNPYWIIWWMTIGLGYVIKSLKFGFLGITVFFIGHILADLGWFSFISLAFSKGKIFIYKRVYHRIILVCGIFLMLFGIWFLYSGIKVALPDI